MCETVSEREYNISHRTLQERRSTRKKKSEYYPSCANITINACTSQSRTRKPQLQLACDGGDKCGGGDPRYRGNGENIEHLEHRLELMLLSPFAEREKSRRAATEESGSREPLAVVDLARSLDLNYRTKTWCDNSSAGPQRRHRGTVPGHARLSAIWDEPNPAHPLHIILFAGQSVAEVWKSLLMPMGVLSPNSSFGVYLNHREKSGGSGKAAAWAWQHQIR
ncbi:hypothetical protein C8R44DRAFT_752583 [Mycena epipterygia]|nr:hypothetical protein C8R44DRAFT_752583 [Mycena epipterygia]